MILDHVIYVFMLAESTNEFEEQLFAKHLDYWMQRHPYHYITAVPHELKVQRVTREEYESAETRHNVYMRMRNRRTQHDSDALS